MAFDNEELNKRREARAKRKAEAAARQKRQQIILLSCIAVFLLAAIIGLLIFISGRNRQPAESQPQTSAAPETTAPPEVTEPPATEPPDTVIHLIAGGDLNITDKVVASGAADTGYDFADCFIDVMPILAGGDLTMLNFEGSLCGAPYGSAEASAPQALVTALRNAGVDLLQTANSRSVFHGIDGLISTMSAIRQEGLEPVGTFTGSEDFRENGGFTMLEVQGIRIAVVAFTKGMDGMGIPAGSEDCVNLLYKDYNSTYEDVDTEGITAVLRNAAAEEPDLTVALLHWGSEYNDQISRSQKSIRALMQAEGVDAIIGTHPHYVQKMELDAETGSFVAWSLGDFFGDGEKSGTNYSVLLDLEVTKDGTTGETKITGYDYTPIFIAYETEEIAEPGEDTTEETTGDAEQTDAEAAETEPEAEPTVIGKLRVLRIREAMIAYENSHMGCVSEEIYKSMESALARIEARVKGE